MVGPSQPTVPWFPGYLSRGPLSERNIHSWPAWWCNLPWRADGSFCGLRYHPNPSWSWRTLEDWPGVDLTDRGTGDAQWELGKGIALRRPSPHAYTPLGLVCVVGSLQSLGLLEGSQILSISLSLTSCQTAWLIPDFSIIQMASCKETSGLTHSVSPAKSFQPTAATSLSLVQFSRWRKYPRSMVIDSFLLWPLN